MKPNPIAANALGTMGTICWTGQLIPQIWKTYKDKKSDGLSPWLMLIWGVSSAFLGVYAILQHLNLPLQLQPQLFGFLGLINWGQCLYYDPHRQNKRFTNVLLVAGTMILVGALEVFLVFISKPAYERGITAPVTLYGVLSAVLIAAGLLPQYWEIYKRKEVIGISYLFISVDALGGLLNDLSLLFAEEFDGLAAVSYSLVIVMDSAILIAALILNPRARRRREEMTVTTVVIETTNELGSIGITEPTTAPSIFTSPTSTLDVEKQDRLAGVGNVIEEKESYEASIMQQVDGMLLAFRPSTIAVVDIEEGTESLTCKPALDDICSEESRVMALTSSKEGSIAKDAKDDGQGKRTTDLGRGSS